MRTEMCSLRDRELRGKTCILTEQTLTNIFKWGWGESKWSCRAIKKEVGKFYGGGGGNQMNLSRRRGMKLWGE